MKKHNILLALIFCNVITSCNVNSSMCQSLNKDEESLYLSLIDRINDTSFFGCTCMLEVDRYSSFLPNQRAGIEYALSVERKIDSTFPKCATIARNDSVFHFINASDMERIKSLYEEWFMRWKKDTTIPQRPLDGTEYRWVNLEGAWLRDVKGW